MRRTPISTRLFLSYVTVLVIAAAVAFLASEASAPTFFARHRGPAMHGMSRMGTQPHGVVDEVDAAYRRAMQQSILLGLGAALLVAGGASLVISRRITAPLRRMHRASERIAEGSYTERLEDDAPGEVGELASAFNRMAGELESTEVRRSALIGNVAHELRTPLSSLQGYIEGISDGYFHADADTLASCSRQVARLRRLVDDLGLLSRVEAGVESIETRPCSLSAIFSQAERDFAARFAEKEVALEVKPPTLSRSVYADPERTLQIVENLLSNALRHTPTGGGVTLEAALDPEAATEVRAGTGGQAFRNATPPVRISVTDTGEGIPPDALPHVFERFYRADPARRKREGAGTGIGLTVAKAFVEAQGGTIRAESTPGSGTTVSFTLPTVPD